MIDGDDIVAPESLDHLRKQAVPDRVRRRVVYDASGIISDEDSGGFDIVQGVDGGMGGVGVQDLLLAHGGGKKQHLIEQGGVLAPVDELAAGLGAVDVQKQQHEKGQQDIDHGIAQLTAAIAQSALFIF